MSGTKGQIEGSARVLVIASHFPPRQAAGVYRTLRFVRYLPALGWDVDVLTLDPSAYEIGAKTDEGLLANVPKLVTVHRTKAVYPLETLNRFRALLTFGNWRSKRNGHRPTGNGVQNYEVNNHEARSAKHETLTTSNYQRPASSLSLWQRAKDFVTEPLTIPDSTAGWIPYAVRRGKRVMREKHVQIVFSSGPPWSNHMVGLKLKRNTAQPWVADFRDPWVDADFKPWLHGDSWAARKHQSFERQVIETADLVILNTSRSRDKLLARNSDLPPEKFVVIPNGYDPEDFEGVELRAKSEARSAKSEASGGRGRGAAGGGIEDCDQESVAISLRSSCFVPGAKNEERSTRHQRTTSSQQPGTDSGSQPSAFSSRLVIAHAGSFYGKRNVRKLIEAVGNICRTGRIPRHSIELNLIGALRAGRDDEQQQARQAGIEDVVQLLPSVSHDECLRRLRNADVLLLVQVGAPDSIPGKVFEYIALGKLIMTLATEGATADLAREERLGPCVDPEDVSAIERALTELYDHHNRHHRSDAISPETRMRYDGKRLTERLDKILRAVLAGYFRPTFSG